MIVQQVSGQRFEDYLNVHVAKPLDMRNSFVSRTEASRHGLATGHRIWFGYPVASDDLPCSPGIACTTTLISSAEDIGHFFAALTNDGRYQGRTILSATS